MKTLNNRVRHGGLKIATLSTWLLATPVLAFDSGSTGVKGYLHQLRMWKLRCRLMVFSTMCL